MLALREVSQRRAGEESLRGTWKGKGVCVLQKQWSPHLASVSVLLREMLTRGPSFSGSNSHDNLLMLCILTAAVILAVHALAHEFFYSLTPGDSSFLIFSSPSFSSQFSLKYYFSLSFPDLSPSRLLHY